MSLHIIKDITEADFGCEEHTDGPHAVLVFEDGTRHEVSERWISENKIEEGKSVWIKEDKSIIKAINVVAAVIRHGDKIFATQRGYGEFKGGWEFPGGKIEDGETPRDAVELISKSMNLTKEWDKIQNIKEEIMKKKMIKN